MHRLAFLLLAAVVLGTSAVRGASSLDVGGGGRWALQRPGKGGMPGFVKDAIANCDAWTDMKAVMGELPVRASVFLLPRRAAAAGAGLRLHGRAPGRPGGARRDVGDGVRGGGGGRPGGLRLRHGRHRRLLQGPGRRPAPMSALSPCPVASH